MAGTALNNVIDFKFAQVFIRDGYSAVGAVNHSGGYTVGATTMVVDGFTTILAVGNTFTVAGDDTIYTITAHAETSSATTSITFTPALVTAPADNAVITVLPHEIEVTVGEGNFTWSRKTPREYKKNRGKLDAVRDADEEPMDVSFDAIWEFIKSNTGEPVTIDEALYREGAAANWVTVGHPCSPYAVDIVVVYTPPCDSAASETAVFEEFRPDTKDGNLKDGTFAIKGQSNRTKPNVTRGAA